MYRFILSKFKTFICLSFFLLIYVASSNAIGKDSVIVKNKWFPPRNIFVGIISVPNHGEYYSDTGKNSGFLNINITSCLYSEYFIFERNARVYSGISVFTSFVHSYLYFRDTTNFGGLGGVVGIRYYLEFSKHRNNMPPKFSGYVGFVYGRGKVYNPPNLNSYNIGTESLGVNYGLNFHPYKIFKRNNQNLTFDISFSRKLFVFKNKEPQPFGGIGIKYKL